MYSWSEFPGFRIFPDMDLFSVEDPMIFISFQCSTDREIHVTELLLFIFTDIEILFYFFPTFSLKDDLRRGVKHHFYLFRLLLFRLYGC